MRKKSNDILENIVELANLLFQICFSTCLSYKYRFSCLEYRKGWGQQLGYVLGPRARLIHPVFLVNLSFDEPVKGDLRHRLKLDVALLIFTLIFTFCNFKANFHDNSEFCVS